MCPRDTTHTASSRDEDHTYAEVPRGTDNRGRAVNIGPREQRKRLIMGVATLAMSVGIAIGLIYSGIDWWWRLGLFFPFWMAALGLFQALEET